jgi:hypothetical protein
MKCDTASVRRPSMTARISFMHGKTGAHRAPLQLEKESPQGRETERLIQRILSQLKSFSVPSNNFE